MPRRPRLGFRELNRLFDLDAKTPRHRPVRLPRRRQDHSAEPRPAQPPGPKVAVIVNDMSEVNIDADLVRDGGANLSRTDEKLVEMTNGCICCTLRDDLLKEVRALAESDRFDYLLIESTGISEPLPGRGDVRFPRRGGRQPFRCRRLDTMVTVVDAVNLLRTIPRPTSSAIAANRSAMMTSARWSICWLSRSSSLTWSCSTRSAMLPGTSWRPPARSSAR